MRVRPLDLAAHGDLRFDARKAGALRRIVPLGMAEIVYAAADMPICLAKDEQTGKFDLVGLMGLVEPVSLFAFPEGFQATYMPRAARLSGFRLDGQSVSGLAIDRDDPAFGESGEALFEGQRPAPWLSNIALELKNLIADIERARELAAAYADRAVLRPLRIRLERRGAGEHEVEGLYTFDQDALGALEVKAVLAMHRADQLAPAAVMSASLAQVERLRQLHNARFTPVIESFALQVR
ncbi:MAG: hypothetical protein CMN72_12945 [Sphingomonas sp.]|nr:hypothetical protein [Sphingomonas sp.]